MIVDQQIVSNEKSLPKQISKENEPSVIKRRI